jgi:2-polyprenyl-6-methoxyphenol hydroxylase-like FAD-dependent oxidoreductase
MSLTRSKADQQAQPILIAGAGPVGLIVALELAHHGVPSVLIDRALEPTRFPKMDVTNARSMELLRRIGLEDAVREMGVASHYSFDVLWALPDGNEPFGKWELPSVDGQRLVIAECTDGSRPAVPWQRALQSDFEKHGRQLCRQHPLIDFREGVSFESLSQDDAGVDVMLSDVTTGEVFSIRAAYVVGADGAGSRVRKALNIEVDVLGEMPPVFMAHFKSKDTATLHRYGRFWHYFVNGCVLISQDESQTWTFHAPLFEGMPTDGEPDPERIMRDRLGVFPKIDEVLLTSIWHPKFALAKKYALGRVFLAGDSAHQLFPTGGYGMNTGVGDAVDIGWKLAAVVKGWAGQALLESYDAERRPVGMANVNHAKRHTGVHMKLGELAASNASREVLSNFIHQHRGENESDGIEMGYRYETSPVILYENSPPPPWNSLHYIPSTWPGSRAPSFVTDDGRLLFDKFGKGFTLVDFQGNAGTLTVAACERGIPLHHLALNDSKIRDIWERDYVLIRPDHHVAWRSNDLPNQTEWEIILQRITGINFEFPAL